MIRVMIVEDDALFRRHMHTMLDWQTLGMMICAEYADGRAALRRMTDDAPDLVLTDISMPQMNGIELIAAIKKEYPKIHVVALSSYDDFVFVKEAMKLGADDYILKQDIATGIDKFVRVLEEVRGRIIPDTAGEADGERQLLLEATMLRILDGSLSSRADIQRRLHRLMVFFPFERYVTAVIVARDACAITDIRTRERIAWQPDGQSAHTFRRAVVALTEPAALSRMAFMIDDHTGVCLFNVKGMFSQSRIHSLMRDTFTQAFGSHFAYSIGLSLQAEGVGGFAASCVQARSAAEDGFLYAVQSITAYEGGDFARLPEDIAALLAQAPGGPHMPKEQAADWTGRLVDGIYRARLRMPAFQKAAESLDKALRERAKAGGRTLRDITGHDRFPLHAMMKSHTSGVLRRFIEDCLLLAGTGGDFAIQTDNYHVNRAIRYINAHYASALGLQQAARTLNINANYLSNLFKQETGQRFMEYVNNVRLAHAAHLMDSSDMRIYEIAHACGFQSVEYFCRLFKEKTGHSPTHRRQ